MRRPLRNQNGAALIASFVLLVIMLTLGSAALMSSTFELKSTNHFNTGNQALYAAESGVLDALSIINTNGVADFANDIIPKWGEKFGTEPKTLIGYPDYTYMVTLAADPDNPALEGMITSVGRAPSNARRIIQARIQKSTIGRGRGALYLAADEVTPTFSGNGFLVDGNDHDQFGALNPDGIVEPGVATRNDDVTGAVKTALDADNWDNVVGLEFSADPPNSSVVTTNGPDIVELEEIITEMLANPSVVVEDAARMNGNAVYGTVDSPQITHMTAEKYMITTNGNASGAGVMIVDGSIVINGTLDFVGWIIVRGDTIMNESTADDTTTTLGNATIQGSLWTGDLVVKVGGSAILNFCEFCINLVDDVPQSGTGYLPRAMIMTSWAEVF
jgi:hypothetical protein